MHPAKSMLLQVKYSMYTLADKAVTMEVELAPPTETVEALQTSAAAETLSKIESSSPLVAVELVQPAQVVTEGQVKHVPLEPLGSQELAKAAVLTLDLVEMEPAQVAVTGAILLADSQAAAEVLA
jgi:hypothetical protein